TTVANGSHTLTATARDASGNLTTSTPVTIVVDNSSSGGGGASGTLWVDDNLPTGAQTGSDGGDTWNWVTGNPSPYTGTKAHQSATSAGLHQHYFDWASAGLDVAAGEVLYAYVYIDPAQAPSELML